MSKGLDRAVETFGNFLDTAVPAASAAVVALTLGSLGTHLNDFAKVTQVSQTAPISVQMAAVAKAVEANPEPVKDMNHMLIEKARYLHNEESHQHFITQLQKWGGFRAILEHPKVKEAKTTAQMINLVDEYFGEKVADLVEANAAAMHLPVVLSR